MIDHIVSSNSQIGHQIVTGLIGGILSLDSVEIDKIVKELESIKEND